jgi:5-methylcytosine-specific restriction endonuclease McrA
VSVLNDIKALIWWGTDPDTRELIMGWELQIGEIKQTYVTDDEIWQALNNFYFHGTTKMSYKYGLLKSLIENLYNVNEKLELNFNDLFYSFTKIYWNLVIHHNLWQSNDQKQMSSIQNVLEDACSINSIPRELTFDKLSDKLQLDILKSVKKIGKKYVIGAFYSDTNNFFYAFDLKKEYLKFNQPVYHFLQKYQRIITYLTNYHLSKFLETYNSVPNINYILNKVDTISKRESLEKFYNILSCYYETSCFYCEKKITKGNRNTHIDHFIPWSFIQNDNLWNLVIACQKCNTRKNDKLAEKKFLYEILDRNDNLSEKMKQENEDYFRNYKSDKLIQLYDYSIYNGLSEIWCP